MTGEEGTEPVRVLQVLGTSSGGVVRHVRQVATALRETSSGGVPLDVRVTGPESLREHLGTLPFATLEISDRPRTEDVATARRLRELLSGCDVAHAHGLRAGALTVLAARTLPASSRPRVVVTLHNVAVGSRGTRAVAGSLETVVARGADVVLGVSGDIVAAVRARGAGRAVRALVPAPGVPATRGPDAPPDSAPDVATGSPPVAEPGASPRPARDQRTGTSQKRAGLGLTAGELVVLTVGRLAPQKGLDTLLDAAAELARRHASGFSWLVAGDGPLRDELADRIAAERLPVRLLGARGDVPDLLAAADVVVSAAVWEGQPIGIQEALAAGAAIVATDAGGTREVTGADGAVLVDVGDAAAIAREVARLLDDADARAAQAAAARARAAELPGTADVVAQLWDVYGLRDG